MRISKIIKAAALANAFFSTTLLAQDVMAPTLNSFGTTGLIDMPTAESQPDAEINATASYFKGGQRNTLTFQVTPRLSGSFRYTKIQEAAGAVPAALFDRSFDVRFQVLKELRFQPAVAIGIQDFIGTGVYSGEYIVATKHIFPSIKVTAGLGWGRFGGQSGYTNRAINFGRGGSVDTGNWFRGDTDFFGGIEWQTPIKGLNLKIEHSSDAYVQEAIDRNLFIQESKWNFGLNYKLSRSIDVAAYYLYGSEFGVHVSFALNPKRSANPSGFDGAALPVLQRPTLTHGQTYDTSWATSRSSMTYRAPVASTLKATGIKLEALKVEGNKATVYIRNTKYVYQAQAIGRTARALTRVLPPSVETFVIVPMQNGIPISEIVLARSTIETLEHHPQGAELLRHQAMVNTVKVVDPDAVYAENLYPDFIWSIKPSSRVSFFDPNSPIRGELGIRARVRYDLKPGLFFAGSIIQPIIGNLDTISRVSDSVLPHVRSDQAQYFREGRPALENLTVNYLYKLTPEIYGRASIGYLESMFGGISGEVLWKPVNRDYAIGAELNYVKQRDFDQRFGFQDYSVVTGHVSFYKDLWNGFTGQFDLGRYLAGDVGGTLSINRTFANGWKVGAFMTLTDVPFEDFGEGSFDKGITLSIPIAEIFGNSTRSKGGLTIRPLTRDGGARLNVGHRLYGVVTEYDRPSIDASFGRAWR